MLRRYQFSLARLFALVTVLAVLLRFAQWGGVESWLPVAVFGTAAIVTVVIATWRNIGDTISTGFLTVIGGGFAGILASGASMPLFAVVVTVGGALAGTLIALIVQGCDRRISARMKADAVHHEGDFPARNERP